MTVQVIEETEERRNGATKEARSGNSATARSACSQAVVEASGFSWRMDLPRSLGGEDRAPSPTSMLLGGLAGSAAVFIKDTLAPRLGVRVDAVRASASCNSDAQGLLGMDGASLELGDVSLDLQVESPSGEAAVRRLLDAWEERCPVYLALTRPVWVKLTSRVIDPYAGA